MGLPSSYSSKSSAASPRAARPALSTMNTGRRTSETSLVNTGVPAGVSAAETGSVAHRNAAAKAIAPAALFMGTSFDCWMLTIHPMVLVRLPHLGQRSWDARPAG